MAKPKPITYGVHPGVALVMKWVAEMKAKTGRSLDEWCDLIGRSGPTDPKLRRDWLMHRYKLGTNTAIWLAERADGQPTWDESPESYLAIAPQYVDQMFGGSNGPMRPVADALMRLAQTLGKDVRICPCKTIIPFYRKHVFAEIKPATKTRIDFGFALGKDVPFTGRLLDTKGIEKKNRITHKIAIASLADIDVEVEKWLREAYGRDS